MSRREHARAAPARALVASRSRRRWWSEGRRSAPERPACGKVVVNEQAWAGSTANTYIAKYVLENEAQVRGRDHEDHRDPPAFQAMADGKIDLVLEDWQHVDQYQQYITKGKKVRVRRQARRRRAHRLVHPAVPAPAVPAVQDVAGPEGEGVRLQVPRVGLAGDVPRRRPVVRAEGQAADQARSGSNLKHVVAGAEPAQVARWTQLYKQKKPVIFYWYTPQYLNQQYQLAEVKLPHAARTARTTPRPAATRAVPLRVRRDRDHEAHELEVRDERLARPQGSRRVHAHQPTRSWSRTGSPATRCKDKAAEKWVKANPARSRRGSAEHRLATVTTRAGRSAPRPPTPDDDTDAPHQPAPGPRRAVALGPRVLRDPRADRHARARARVGRQRARADGAARRGADPGARGAPRPRPGAARRGVPAARDLRLRRRRRRHRGLSEVRLVLESKAARLAAERRNDGRRDRDRRAFWTSSRASDGREADERR